MCGPGGSAEPLLEDEEPGSPDATPTDSRSQGSSPGAEAAASSSAGAVTANDTVSVKPAGDAEAAADEDAGAEVAVEAQESPAAAAAAPAVAPVAALPMKEVKEAVKEAVKEIPAPRVRSARGTGPKEVCVRYVCAACACVRMLNRQETCSRWGCVCEDAAMSRVEGRGSRVEGRGSRVAAVVRCVCEVAAI